MNRRTLLQGISAGGIVPATHLATTTGVADDGPVSVRIVDVPDAVSGGEWLEWTVEVRNPTDRSLRPTVEFVVDGEPLGSSTLTVGPGETARPSTPTYPTEPVAEDDEVTVRVRSDGDSDERTVRLLGVEELPDGVRSPDRDVTVRPGTTVHFEVGVDDSDARWTTDWWVDGERVGYSPMNPWHGVYETEYGTHYRQETFETRGTSEVVAGVEIDDAYYRTSWTVTVSPSGPAGPSVEAARPDPGPLAVDPGDPTELAVDVADPEGNLDRVVWWLTQADAVLGESDVSGASDTATLALESRCHTCQVVPWVLTSDGRFTAQSVWVLDDPDTGVDAGLDLTITGTNDPVDAGELLEVTVTCENAGSRDVTQSVDLVVGHDPELVDSRSVTVAAGATETVVLEFETASVANDQSFPARVETDASADERTVLVRGYDA